MGQIIGSAAKPERCNISKLSQLGIPAAGEHILVSSDNSMNAAGQGNFDSYIVGDGTTAATALELHDINEVKISDATYDYSYFNLTGYYANGTGAIVNDAGYRRTALIKVMEGDVVEVYTGTASNTIDNIAVFNSSGQWIYGLDIQSGAKLTYTYKVTQNGYIVAQTRNGYNDSYVKITHSTDGNIEDLIISYENVLELQNSYSSNNVAKADLSGAVAVTGFTSKRYEVTNYAGQLIRIVGSITLDNGYAVASFGINNPTSPVGIANYIKSTGEAQNIDTMMYVPQACRWLWITQPTDLNIKVYIVAKKNKLEEIDTLADEISDLNTQVGQIDVIDGKVDALQDVIDNNNVTNITSEMFTASSISGVTITDYIPVQNGDIVIAKTKGAYNRAQILVYDTNKTLKLNINNGQYSTDYVMEYDGYVQIEDQTNDVQNPSATIIHNTTISELVDDNKKTPKVWEIGVDDMNRNMQFYINGVDSVIRYQRNNEFRATRWIELQAGDAIMLYGNNGYIVVNSEPLFINGNDGPATPPSALNRTYDNLHTAFKASEHCYVMAGAKYGDGYSTDVRCVIRNAAFLESFTGTIQESVVNFDTPKIIPEPNNTYYSTQESTLLQFRDKVLLYQTWYNSESEDQELIVREYNVDTNTCGQVNRIAYRGVLGNDGTGTDPSGFSRSVFFIYNGMVYGLYLDALNNKNRLIRSADGITGWELVATNMFPEVLKGNFSIIPYKIEDYYYAFVEHGGTGGWQMSLFRSTIIESGWVLVGALSFDGESTGMNGGAMPYYQDGKFKMFYHYGPTGTLPTYLAYAEADFNDPLHFHKVYEPLMLTNQSNEYIVVGQQFADIDIRNVNNNAYMLCSFVYNGSPTKSQTFIWKCNGNIYDILRREW